VSQLCCALYKVFLEECAAAEGQEVVDGPEDSSPFRVQEV
jgi:hypothetical protein